MHKEPKVQYVISCPSHPSQLLRVNAQYPVENILDKIPMSIIVPEEGKLPTLMELQDVAL